MFRFSWPMFSSVCGRSRDKNREMKTRIRTGFSLKRGKLAIYFNLYSISGVDIHMLISISQLLYCTPSNIYRPSPIPNAMICTRTLFAKAHKPAPWLTLTNLLEIPTIRHRAQNPGPFRTVRISINKADSPLSF